MSKEIFRSSEVVVRSARDFGSSACVVTFDSYTDHRDLDREAFGEDFFRHREIDAIHVIGRENDWYQYAEMPVAAAAVAEAAKGYERVIAYGSSMGGYAAIRFGGMAGARVALAISPQFSIDPKTARFERRWKYDSHRIDFSLERTLRDPFVDMAYIVYDPHDVDRRHANMFRRRTRVIDVRLPNAGHPATGAIAQAGLLSDLVLDVVHDRLDVDEMARRMLERHEGNPQFHYVMSGRARGRRVRLAHAARAAAMAPWDIGLATHYASLLSTAGRLAEAQIAFARAATIEPNHPVLLNHLTHFYQRRGDLEGAIEVAEILVSLHSRAFGPRLDQLRRLRDRRFGWPNVTIAGRCVVGAWSLPLDVRVTTTPSPPPFVGSWRRHEALMAARPETEIDIFLVGGSLAECWPSDLWAPLSVFNFGVKADKTQHTLWRLEQLPAASVNCRHAVILVGTNNLEANDTVAGIAAGVAAVVAGVVRVAPHAKVWVIGTPPARPEGREFRSNARRRANAAVAGISGFGTIDVDRVLAASERTLCDEPDGIHLGKSEYKRLTEAVMCRVV